MSGGTANDLRIADSWFRKITINIDPPRGALECRNL
jgi:hypothetical protein